MSKATEINALIRLLDDEDPNVYKNVTNKLISYGKEVVPMLESVWEDDFNPAVHERIENLIHQINFESVKTQLKDWIADEEHNLLNGALIVASYHFSDVKKEHVQLMVSQIKQKIWLELHDYLTPLEQVNVFNQIFYGLLGFGGSYSQKPEMRDYCVNYVLESKNGTSISLGLIYMIIAHELQLPIYGVLLNRHFVLSYQKRFIQDFTQDYAEESVFYINPMNKGMVFQREEIKTYLKSLKQEPQTSDYTPASNKLIVLELLKYLLHYFSSNDELQKVEEIQLLIELFE
ncbi:MAG: transglutaminase family protein [Chitinophagales bacterium]